MNNIHVVQFMSLTSYLVLLICITLFVFVLMDEIHVQSKWSRFTANILDVIVVLLCGGIFYIIIIYKNLGLLRSYVLVGLALGVVLYQMLLKGLYKRICKYIVPILLLGCRKIKWLLLTPMRIVHLYIIQRVKKLMMQCRCKNKIQGEEEIEEIT